MTARPRIALVAAVVVAALAYAGCSRVADELAAGCTSGQKECAGRCVRIDDPAFGCGSASCSACQVSHATAACEGELCAVGSCEEGFDDCDAVDDNGCEVSLTDDPAHCGACTTPCSLDHATEAACAKGACVVTTCEDGYRDCNDRPDDGCEVDVRADTANCGACEHDCLGGACSESRCGPVVMYQAATLVSGVAVDDAWVYFGQANDGIARIAKAAPANGAVPETVVSASLPLGMAVRGAQLVYSDNGQLLSVDKRGGAPGPLVNGPFEAPWGVALDAKTGDLYWANSGSTAQVAGIWRLALDGTVHAYELCPTTGACGIRQGLAVADDGVFWSLNNFLPGGVIGAKKSDSSQTVFVQSTPTALFVAVDETYVYWTTQDVVGFRARDPVAPVQTLAQVNGYGGIAVDETNVYFGEAIGKTLKRVRKPPPP